MEYTSIVWASYQIAYSNSLERIQRRVARWATSNHSRLSSVSDLLKSLKWSAPELHCKIARPKNYIQIKFCRSSFVFRYYKQNYTRQCHPLHMIIPYIATSAYQGSFFHILLKIGMSHQYV